MKRLFIGIPVKSEKAFAFSRQWQNNRLLNQNKLVWTLPSNWHITLYFLGATPEDQVALLSELIVGSFQGASSFNTEITGVGVFPNTHNPKVLWLGFNNLRPLQEAYKRLGELLQANSFPYDPKPLKPHLTLARIKSLGDSRPLDNLLSEFREHSFGTISIDRVVLFESISTPSGPVYKPLFVQQLSE
jgi:2'-5' RNA ligase